MNIAIAELRHPKAGKPSSQYVYRSEDGSAVLVANRFDRGVGKFFIPFDLVANDWKAPENRPLYRLDELVAANEDRAVIVTEGEKCADALTALGFVATTTYGGAQAPHKSDLSALYGRNVYVWPDKDEAGKTYAEKLCATLRSADGTTPKIIPVSDLALRSVTYGNESGQTPNARYVTYEKGWDAADAASAGWTVGNVNTLLKLAAPYEGTAQIAPQIATPSNDNESPELFDGIDLWHTPEGKPYASIKRGNNSAPQAAPWETFALESAAFKRLLAHAAYQTSGKVPPAAKLDDQVRQMIGEALFEGERREVFTRIGSGPDTLGPQSIVLDLGRPDWSTVHVTSDGWSTQSGAIQSKTGPRFKRAPSMAPLPVPIKGTAGMDLLRPFVNVATDDDFRLMVGWLMGCLRPSGPYPLLILTGEQGSAKSTTSKVLRALVDPSTLATRSFPSDERDLVIAAQGAHVLAFDNLSKVKPAMADALCRLATGGGFATRKLHSDADEVLFDATRPVILNGIPDLAERADLSDRAISLHLPTISPQERTFETDFWSKFEDAQALILAALLDAASHALASVAHVALTERPRMADFARWVTAAEPALGWTQGAFLTAYAANRKEAAEVALDGNAVASCILALVRDWGAWRGTATDLIAHLRITYPALTESAEAFPRQAAAFGAELRRVTPLLRAHGVEVAHLREGKDRRRVVCVSKKEDWKGE
ncbi:hypothetical protein [Pacificibacter sp.]|uniref:hypothetical protein n=1 Tax=Pacificibacter sp. TaxID=1917866 RepID=UPI00321969D8